MHGQAVAGSADMRINDIIAALIKEREKRGNIRVFVEDNDGRSTSAREANVSIKYKEIWPNHPAGMLDFITF